jgi:hypothetical protein
MVDPRESFYRQASRIVESFALYNDGTSSGRPKEEHIQQQFHGTGTVPRHGLCGTR